MQTLYLTYLSWHIAIIILLHACLIFSIYQILQQQQVIYLLLYQLLFLVYGSLCLVYYNIDINAIVLILVYGGFIAVVVILSFFWTNYTVSQQYFTPRSSYIYYIFIIFLCLFNFLSFNTSIFLQCGLWNLVYINYYELSGLDTQAELEVAGWGIGLNTSGLVIISIALSITCIAFIFIVLRGRELHISTRYYSTLANDIFIYLRTQNNYMQDYKMLGGRVATKHLFHRRRI